MDGFKEGYEFFEKTSGSCTAAYMGNAYVESVNSEIDELINNLNGFKGFKTDPSTLKGDIAEFWHSGTFNIGAALNGSKNRTTVDRSHDFASADITSNFGEMYGLKYYQNGTESAKAQATSIFQRFKEYQTQGGKDSLEEFLTKRGYTDPEVILNDPIYIGQVRIIPKDQLEDAIKWLERKIREESVKRPDQVQRYQDTLNLLKDKIQDNEGNESIPLSKADAEKLARLSKEGNVNAKELGLTTEELIKYEYVLKQAFKAGMTAATISMVLRVAPEIFKAIKYLINTGDIDEKQFQKIGFAAIQGSAEGFIRGSISAAVTTACKAGLMGETFKGIDPSIVGAVTVLVMNTMKNSFKVATGKMSKRELANELVKEMFITTCSLVGGGISQSIIELPVLGFMIGSFVGSMVGSFAYSTGYKAILSFCADTGFTMFGLVEQDYTLPIDVMKEIGIEVFEYDKFEYDTVEPDKFEYDRFEYNRFEMETVNIMFLRRGVIGVSQIGYV